MISVSYTHLRAHETDSYLVCRLLLEKKKKHLLEKKKKTKIEKKLHRYVNTSVDRKQSAEKLVSTTNKK